MKDNFKELLHADWKYICSVVQSELWVIFHGINLAREHGFSSLEIHSDSKDVIRMVKGLKDLHVRDKCTVDATKACIVPLMNVHFVHVFRVRNKVADHLLSMVCP